VWLTEDDEKVPLARVLQFVGHVQVGVHACLQDRDFAQLVELGGMGIVVEGASDEDIEPSIASLLGGRYQIKARNGAELRTDEDRCAFLCPGLSVAFGVFALSADKMARPRSNRRKCDLVLLVGLLDSRSFQIFQNHLYKVGLIVFVTTKCPRLLEQFVVFTDRKHTVGREALNRERSGDTDFLVILVRLVV